MDTTQTYFQAMEVLEAQDKMFALTCSAWPNMKERDRIKLHRDLHRKAYPRTYRKVTDPDELAKILGGARIIPKGNKDG